MPDRDGSNMPPVRPNEWNMGRVLNIMSVGTKSILAATWWRLDCKFRWDRATPLGTPSDPDVKSTAAVSLGLWLPVPL